MTTYTAEDNKRIVADAMSALAWGDSAPYAAAMHDDYTLVQMYASRRGVWGERYAGKDAARRFYRAWHAQMDGPLLLKAERIFADGDHVIVEAKGQGKMRGTGEAYNQSYCMVIRMEDGKMREVREYFDVALADALFEPVAP